MELFTKLSVFTVEREMLVAPYFFQLVTTNFGEIYYFANFAK